MKTRFLCALILAVSVPAGLWPRQASAIPVFARKYGFQCTMCHSNIPRLNDFGQRYRMNGYRLPGRENEERTVLESLAPLALRTSAGYVFDDFNRAAGNPDVSDFQLFGLDLLSAGLLGRNIGYFMVYVPQISEAPGLAGQDGSLEMASVVFSNLADSWLNVRVGRFEPAYVPFSVKRQLSASPYEVFDYSFRGGPAFSETQSGVELTGYDQRGFQYAAGVVKGSGTNHSNDTPSDVYGRATYVIGAGEGQTVGHRLGVVGYMGRSRPAPNGTGSTARESFYRWGVDASLTAPYTNLVLEYLFSRDDKSLWRDATKPVDYSGGFAELSVLPLVDLVGFARFDLVKTPDIINHDITRWTVGGRYYFEDNVAVHAEVSRRNVDSGVERPGLAAEDATETFVTTRLDVAF